MNLIEQLRTYQENISGDMIPIYETPEICNEAADEIERLTAERDHWKANHDNQVAKARILMERPDLPLERVEAYTLVELAQSTAKQCEVLLHRQAETIERLTAESALYRTNLDALDAANVQVHAENAELEDKIKRQIRFRGEALIERDTLAAQVVALREALEDLTSCMEGVIEGDYKPDSFTLQPAQNALSLSTEQAGAILREREAKVFEDAALYLEQTWYANAEAELRRLAAERRDGKS